MSCANGNCIRTVEPDAHMRSCFQGSSRALPGDVSGPGLSNEAEMEVTGQGIFSRLMEYKKKCDGDPSYLFSGRALLR